MDGAVWVVLGSGLGGMARYGISGLVARRIGETFPWGTMVVNATGSFAIGALAALAALGHAVAARPEVWQLAAVGFLGSYTTVSSFSLQTLALVRDGEWLRGILNLLMSLALGLGGVAIGLVAGHAAMQAWS